jgi:hypothetical protein
MRLAVLMSVVLASCWAPQEHTGPAPQPDASQTEGSTPAAYGPELASCAGAIAAYANIDVANFPERDGEWESAFATMLALLDKEPPFAGGQTARQAVEAQRVRWTGQPRAAIEEHAQSCRARFQQH